MLDSSLLEAASMIVERGAPLTMDTLAAEAGVSRSTVYRRTGGRAALMRALAERGLEPPDEPTTRERLLAAVRSCVARQGIVRVSVESLAAEAGVSPVTVYRLFGDRKSLLREALAGMFPIIAMQTLARDDAPLPQALELLAAGVIRFVGSYPGLMALVLAPASADRAEFMQIQGLQVDLRQQLTTVFESQAESGRIPPGDGLERAGAFMGLCLGASLLLHEVRPLRNEDVQPRARRVVRHFLKGL